MSAGEVVIVSGPPGSGKTTVAGALATEAELGVHLESDWFFRAIVGGFIPPHLPAAHSQNTTVIDVTIDAAAAYASAGYLVVWDGIVGPWFLDRVAQRLAARGVRLRYLVLRPPREVALARVRERDSTTELSGAETMNDQFADLGDFESHVIASGGDAAEVLALSRAATTDDCFVVRRDPWVEDRWPVSVKGVLTWDDGTVVLRNRRDEWELPGGRLDATDASPEDTLRREFAEELGLDIVVGAMIDSWIYDVEGKRVLILTYRCDAAHPTRLAHSDEHIDVALMTADDLAEATIPDGYVRAIAAATDAGLGDVGAGEGADAEHNKSG